MSGADYQNEATEGETAVLAPGIANASEAHSGQACCVGLP